MALVCVRAERRAGTVFFALRRHVSRAGHLLGRRHERPFHRKNQEPRHIAGLPGIRYRGLLRKRARSHRRHGGSACCLRRRHRTSCEQQMADGGLGKNSDNHVDPFRCSGSSFLHAGSSDSGEAGHNGSGGYSVIESNSESEKVRADRFRLRQAGRPVTAE